MMRYRASMLCAATMMLAGCNSTVAEVEKPRLVRTLTVQQSPITREHIYAGEIRPRRESELGFRVGGKIALREVNVGDLVKAGQVLLRLDAGDLSLSQKSSDATVAALRAQFAVAELDFKRYEQLVEDGAVSRADFDNRSATFKAAQANLNAQIAQARQIANQTGYAELRADHDGLVTAISAEGGQVVSAGQTVVQLAHSGETEVLIDVPENQVFALRVGSPVRVRVWADNSQFAGVVREVSSSADRATRTYPIRVSISGAARALKLGMTASVIVSGDPGQTSIQIPITALVEIHGETSVWVVDPDNSRVRRRKVTCAEANGNELIVTDGLRTGEVVVTAGAPLLVEGMRVRL